MRLTVSSNAFATHTRVAGARDAHRLGADGDRVAESVTGLGIQPDHCVVLGEDDPDGIVVDRDRRGSARGLELLRRGPKLSTPFARSRPPPQPVAAATPVAATIETRQASSSTALSWFRLLPCDSAPSSASRSMSSASATRSTGIAARLWPPRPARATTSRRGESTSRRRGRERAGTGRRSLTRHLVGGRTRSPRRVADFRDIRLRQVELGEVRSHHSRP